jgi:hypothetical protein
VGADDDDGDERIKSSLSFSLWCSVWLLWALISLSTAFRVSFVRFVALDRVSLPLVILLVDKQWVGSLSVLSFSSSFVVFSRPFLVRFLFSFPPLSWWTLFHKSQTNY